MPSYYIAEARVVVGVPALRVLNIESVLADLNPDADQIQNEAYVVQSRAVAGQVVDSQRLMQDPEFNPTLAPPSFWSRLLARADRLISGVREKLPAELRKDDSEDRTRAVKGKRVSVRVGLGGRRLITKK